jgi:hypothetical protein
MKCAPNNAPRPLIFQEKCMAEPKKKPPSKESLSFLEDRRGRAFDIDDEPAAPVQKNKPAPKTEQKPEPKPRLRDDFEPYRGPQSGGFTGPIHHDEFGMYDDDETDSDFWNEGDDAEDDPLHAIANKILPDRPEINLALNLRDELDLTGLVAAGLIEEEMRGRNKDKTVDTLTAAALLVDAEDFDEMANHLAPETVSLVDEFMAAISMGPENAPFETLNMQTQRLIVAMTTADLEMLSKGMKNGTMIAPEEYELEIMGEFLADASRSASEKPTAGDVRLMKRAVRAFNEVSHIMPLDVKLRQAEDLGFDLVDKDTPEPKQKGPSKPSPKPNKGPKPPRH